MKVAVCTKALKNGSKNRGVGVYTRELLASLHKNFPRDKYLEVAGNPYIMGADLVHYPFFDPYYLTLPWTFKQKTIITIHDLIPLKYPAHFQAGLRGKLKWLIQKYRVRCASAILTDSHSSSCDIQAIMGIEESKISVIPLAPGAIRSTAALNRKAKNTYHLPDRYILYVGDINWNKNVPGLINSFAAIKDKTVHLVLVGKVFASRADIPEYRAVSEAIDKSSKSDLIHRLGYVPSHHLPSIYALADLYCQPSFDEGFGLPVLEAMQAGCPVLSSNAGSLGEVGGEAASYFDPRKNELTQKLTELLDSSEKRQALVVAGLAHVKQFTWDRTAKLTREIYAKILDTI